MAKKRARKKPGDVVKIEIGDGHSSFARVLNYSELAFYDGKYQSQPALCVIAELPVSFIIPVMNFWSKTDGWEIIGNLPLEPELLEEPTYFKQDAITGTLCLYLPHQDIEVPCTRDQVENLERAAVWDPEHIEDRLKDHYNGVPNKWVESMKPLPLPGSKLH